MLKTVSVCTFIVDLTVSVDVCFSDHLVYFLICELLSQIGHHMTQLCRRDVSVAILTNIHKRMKVSRTQSSMLKVFEEKTLHSTSLVQPYDFSGHLLNMDHVNASC